MAALLEKEESIINKQIERFFADKSVNAKGVRWFSPEQKIKVPECIREHYLSLRSFFRKKNWHCGGSIPPELIYTQTNFHLIQNISLSEAIDLAYEAIDKCKNDVIWMHKNADVLNVLKVIKECEKKGIQQEHIAGILLLYLKLCVNVDF